MAINKQKYLGRDIARDRNYSEEVASAIDREVRHFVDICYNKATSLLTENRDRLDKVAAALLEKETLEAEELAALMMTKDNNNNSENPSAGNKEPQKQPNKMAELRITYPTAPQQA